MRTKSLVFSTVALVALLVMSSLTRGEESSGPRPDRWHGLVLDESTIDQARSSLGEPAKEKEDKFYAYALRGEFEKKLKLLWLEWKNVPGFDKVRLGFGIDKKLAVIELDLKDKLPPASIAHNYGMVFEPVFNGMDVGWFPERYQRDQGKTYARQYPGLYYLVGVAERSLVFAQVTQGTFAMVGKELANVADTQGFPGNVERLQLVSRSMETKQGGNILE